MTKNLGVANCQPSCKTIVCGTLSSMENFEVCVIPEKGVEKGEDFLSIRVMVQVLFSERDRGCETLIAIN